MNQTQFLNNSSINLKQKRLRHLNSINAKNLQINSNRFNVWFTLHLTRNSQAFYISDKKENDRNPKWNLINLNKISLKEFTLRIWYSNLDDNLNKTNQSKTSTNRLNLLLELDVNLDFLSALTDTNLTYSIKNLANILIFEIFGLNFSEPFLSNDKKQTPKRQIQPLQPQLKDINLNNSNNLKRSYNLNLMIRLHDFQRVIYEAQKKISHLKNNSLAKFDASSKLRQLQLRREEKLQRILLYKESLIKLNQSISKLGEFNSKINEATKIYKNNLDILKRRFSVDKEKMIKLREQTDSSLNSNLYFKNELKNRQKQLINDLSNVFQIEINQNGIEQTGFNLKLNNSKILSANLRLKSINGLNNVNIDQENSVALGYITQSIQMLANILCIPLRYPVVFKSSRSFIIEQIDEFETRKFALFKQNSSQDANFSYAIGLLQTNIIQIRILFDSYKNIDQEDLLVNLKWIFDYFKT